jgi:hypothetical protein
VADSWPSAVAIEARVSFLLGMFRNPQVLALFAGQYWVASIWQLRELGVSDEAVGRACRAGLIERVTAGVYRLTSAEFGLEGRCMAVLLKSPEHSYISGPTAGRLYGLRRMSDNPVEITVPWNVRRRQPQWARQVRSDMDVPDRDIIQRRDGLVVASPLRTLFRLAGLFNQFRFEQAAEDMWHRRLVSPNEAADYLVQVRRSGRTGVERFERWLARTAVMQRPAASGMEQELLRLVDAAGLPEPVRQFPLQLLNGDLIHIDMAWPNVRFGLEPGHTWWHGGDLKMRSDQGRDRACGEVGWLVARFDEVSIGEPGVAGQVRRMYHQRVATAGTGRATSA